VERRKFISLLGGAALAWPLAADAQQARMRRIGILLPGKEDAALARRFALVTTWGDEMTVSSDIVGVWKIRTFALVDSGGGQIKPFGEKPNGQAVFTAGGHVALVMTGETRKAAAGATATSEEASALFSSMAAAAGTYRLEGNTLTVSVTSSWNESWTGTQQIRSVELKDGQLTLSSAPARSPALGKEVAIHAIYDRIE
jgi:hypothetical protein